MQHLLASLQRYVFATLALRKRHSSITYRDAVEERVLEGVTDGDPPRRVHRQQPRDQVLGCVCTRHSSNISDAQH